MSVTIQADQRIATLDILRGVAVMGILAMNAAVFAMPAAAYFNPAAYGGADGIDLAIWVGNHIFVDGKMRGLFSLLFGASLLLVVMRAEANGENETSVHYRRMLWLLIFGAIHLYLIWYADILLHYALIGLIAFLFRNAGLRTLSIWIAVLLTVNLVIMAGLSFGFLQTSAAAAAPGASAEVTAAWASMSADFAPLSADALAADLATHRGDYAGIVEDRIADYAWMPVFMFFFGGVETLALMLIGMAGLRSGFLTGAWVAERYRTIALWCILIGAAASAALAWLAIDANFEPAMVFATAFGGTALFRPLMAVGYAALIILLTRRGGTLVARIAAAGRAAFTNYLGTSLVMTTIFYGYGLGLYGSVGRAELYLFVLAMWALMLAWSKPWLDLYRYGPFEWMWRSLARWRLQPMRRAKAAA